MNTAFACQDLTENGDGTGFAKVGNVLQVLLAPRQEIRSFLFVPGGVAADI